MKIDVSLSGGGSIKVAPHDAHTDDKAPSNVAGFLERVFVQSRVLGNELENSALVGDLLHALACGSVLPHGFDAHVVD